MADKAQLNRSVNTLRTELEYLRDSGMLNPGQFNSIAAQLPHNGAQSQYTDPFYGGSHPVNPAQIAQEAQDPKHPANPHHPKHHEWIKAFAQRFGQAAVFGAGATAGSDLVNAIFK